MKFMKEFIENFSRQPAFSSSEARNFFSFRNGPKGYYKTAVNNLIMSGRLRRITRGHYTFHDEVQFVGFAFKPFYYGLEDALSLRNLWEQETNPVIITPRKVRSGLRTFEGRNYVVRWIDRSMFFGYSPLRYGDIYIPVADPEKILIDMVYYHEFLSGEVIEGLLEVIDKDLLDEYLYRLKPSLRMKVLAILKGNGKFTGKASDALP